MRDVWLLLSVALAGCGPTLGPADGGGVDAPEVGDAGASDAVASDVGTLFVDYPLVGCCNCPLDGGVSP